MLNYFAGFFFFTLSTTGMIHERNSWAGLISFMKKKTMEKKFSSITCNVNRIRRQASYTWRIYLQKIYLKRALSKIYPKNPLKSQQ